eukprot:5464-Heterococcus_DN1.PRE.2
MIVGPTGGGKSLILDTLKNARLPAEGVNVKYYVLNPKKQTLGELYGVMDPVTRDWTDGVLSKLFRELNAPLPGVLSQELHSCMITVARCKAVRNALVTTSKLKPRACCPDCKLDAPLTHILSTIACTSLLLYCCTHNNNNPLTAGREQDFRCIVFDGDVDAVWVENMNSVMDDNKLLTLPNGERIRLQPHCAMICETFDLQYASPATISRCGMVWVDPKNLGYRPYYERWVRLRCGDGVVLSDEGREPADVLTTLYNRYVKQCIEYVLTGVLDGVQAEKLRQCSRTVCAKELRYCRCSVFTVCCCLVFAVNHEQQVIPVTGLDMVKQLCSSLGAFLTPQVEDRGDVEGVFLFCLVWSVGAALVGSSRDKFDELVKRLAGGSAATPRDSIYAHRYNTTTHKWEAWTAPAYVQPQPFKFHEVMVPTTDSVTHTYLLDNLAPRKPVLFVGDSGTAKTITVERYMAGLKQDAYARLAYSRTPVQMDTLLLHAVTAAAAALPHKHSQQQLVNFSSRTTARDVQISIEASVDKRAGAVYGPANGKKLVVFIDDMNMPKVDLYGTQQPIALLHFLVSKGALYDRGKDLSVKYIKYSCCALQPGDSQAHELYTPIATALADLQYIGAMGPPGGGRNAVDPRFVALFNVYNLTAPSEAALKLIFSSILTQKLANFTEPLRTAAALCPQATLRLFSAAINKLPPTPSKFHYIFNLRDLSRVFEGLCLATEDCYTTELSIVRLWRNECLRVFGDRLLAEDAPLLASEIEAAVRGTWSAPCAEGALADPLVFGDFESAVARLGGASSDDQDATPLTVNRDASTTDGDAPTAGASLTALCKCACKRHATHTTVCSSILVLTHLTGGVNREDAELYTDMGDFGRVRRVFDEVLESYNVDHKPMNLVLFESALEHLVRIYRVLRLPRGNALLVGVGGSGKKSLTRLAAYCAGYKVFEIKLVRNYGEAEFKADLKELYKMLVLGPVVFLLTDAHVVEEGFLEFINNMITTGIVPALFEKEELSLQSTKHIAGVLVFTTRAHNTLFLFASHKQVEACNASVRPLLKEAGLQDTPDACWQLFLSKCRGNLHIVLAMSPSGDKLRLRCRNFPGLVSASVIDWFQPWPADALKKVAQYFLADEGALPEELREPIVEHLVLAHQ